MGALATALASISGVDAEAAAAARRRCDRLAKPQGSLGRLEALGEQLCAIARQCPPPLPAPAAIAVFAGDHGVVARGVTPWPSDVTAQMVATFLRGDAAINVLARGVGASVTVVDVGVAVTLEAASGLRRMKVRPGTADLAAGPAMTPGEATAALDAGAEVASALVADGARALVPGDMGIGNTTAAAALIAALTGAPPAAVTGRGTGIDDQALAHKVAVVEEALGRLAPDADAITTLADVGGLEIAALAGCMVGGAAARRPVIVDGVVAVAAALVAAALEPRVVGYCVAGHRSSEPGASIGLRHLGLAPLLDLDLRLGEGTGACLALPLLEAAARILREMATLDRAIGTTDAREVGRSPGWGRR